MTHAEISSSKVYSPDMTATVSHTPKGHLSATRQWNRTLITTVHWQKIYNGQRKKEKPFLNLMHCFQTNPHFFLNWQGPGGWGKMLHCMARKQKLNHVMSVKTDTLKRTWHPGPIQCETKNFSSCLFRKLSREEKHLFFFSVRTS